MQLGFWFVAMVGLSWSIALAAEPETQMSFGRECKRLASDRLGSAAVPATRTTAPRASPTLPLPQPALPSAARARGVEKGTVVLDVFVTELGQVADVRVQRSSGDADLDRAAMLITQHWRLIPGAVDGIPVCLWGRFAIAFDGERGTQFHGGPAFSPVAPSDTSVTRK